MDQKKVIEKLIKIAENQQEIIKKLVKAQAAPPDALHPNSPSQSHPGLEGDAAVINAALPPALKGAIASLSVSGNDVNVKFYPGKGTDQVFNALIKFVGQLQQAGKLRNNSSPYQVKEVA